jgi:hypothetical protein
MEFYLRDGNWHTVVMAASCRGGGPCVGGNNSSLMTFDLAACLKPAEVSVLTSSWVRFVPSFIGHTFGIGGSFLI